MEPDRFRPGNIVRARSRKIAVSPVYGRGQAGSAAWRAKTEQSHSCTCEPLSICTERNPPGILTGVTRDLPLEPPKIVLFRTPRRGTGKLQAVWVLEKDMGLS